MLNKTPIEETFRNAFDNFEADVNDRVWTNIEQHLPTPASPPSGNVAGEAANTIISGSKFSALTYGIASSVIIAIIGASYFFLSPDNNEAPVANPVKIAATEKPAENIISTEVKNLTADSKHENTLSLPKTDNKKTKLANVNNISTTQEAQNPQNVSNEHDNNAPQNQQVASPVTTNEDKEAYRSNNNVGNKPTQTASTKENNSPSAADEKHESNNSEEGTNATQEPQEDKPSQDDDFEWGVIPNSFSPNNDGKNDVFAINTHDLKSIILVMIYDRNGREVYNWNNKNGSWDGWDGKDLKGNEMPVGTYIYYIFGELPEGKFHSKNGTISIFR